MPLTPPCVTDIFSHKYLLSTSLKDYMNEGLVLMKVKMVVVNVWQYHSSIIELCCKP